MSRNQLRAFLGLESNGIDVDINIGSTPSTSGDALDDPMVTPVASSGAMTPEAAEVEVQESAAEVDTVEDEITETEEDVSALESYQQLLSKSLDNNGINVVSAEMLNVGLDHILKKYGVTSNELVPGLEDYSNNAYATTRISMEKVEEAKEGLKERIKEKVMEFINKVIEFFQNLAVKLIPAVKFRVNMLAKLAGKAKNEKAGEKIKLGGGSANLLLQVPDYKQAFKNYKNKIITTGEVLKGVVTELTSAIKSGSLSEGEIKSHKDLLKNGGLFSGAVEKDGKHIAKSEFNINGYSLKMAESGWGTVIDLNDGSVAPEKKEIPENTEVQPLSKTECVEMCKTASELIEYVEKLVKHFESSKVAKSFKDRFNRDKGTENAMKDEQIKTCKSFISAMKDIASEATKIINAVMKAVHASLRALGVETPAEAAPAAEPAK